MVINLCQEPQRLLLIALFTKRVARWQHASVKNTGNPYPVGAQAIEDYVLPLLDPAEAGLDFVTDTTQERVPGELVATLPNGVQVPVGLSQTPFVECVPVNIG